MEITLSEDYYETLELEAPCRLKGDAENKLRGVTLAVGNKF